MIADWQVSRIADCLTIPDLSAHHEIAHAKSRDHRRNKKRNDDNWQFCGTNRAPGVIASSQNQEASEPAERL
jgi:hypothetical protein